ncbi:MAG: hypothetical protein EHM14_11635 [Methanothrix sp.]|nr:MAG: hypothetical protein EHM14_11635 [Methanothrix sp.]
MKFGNPLKILCVIIFIAFISCFSSLFIGSAGCAASVDASPAEEWSKSYGGPYGDGVWSLAKASDGGYVLTGYTSMLGQGSDLWLFKVDGSGNAVWQKILGGSGEDAGYYVREVSDDGYVVTGSTASLGIGEERLWLLKMDKNGSLQWSRVFGGFVSSSGDGGWSLDESGDGGYIVTGYTQSFGSGKKDLWLLKTDGDGELQWEKAFGGREDDVGMSVVRTGDGGYVAAGRTASFGKGGDDIWLLKTDSQGTEEWNKTFGGKSDDAAFQVIETDGGLAVVGRTESGIRDKRIILIKTDPAGQKLWDRTYQGSSGTSLQRTSDGGFIIAGRLDSEKTGRDALLIKTDSDGREQWSLPISAEGDGIGTFALEIADGAYVFAGIANPSRSEAEDAWLRKYGAARPEGEAEANFGNETVKGTILQGSPQTTPQGSLLGSLQDSLQGSSDAAENVQNLTGSRENLSKFEKIFKDELQ